MRSLNRLIACAILVLGLASCSGGGSDGGGTTTPPAPGPPPAPPAGSVTVTGTVSGTVIKILNAETNTVIRQFDTATLNQAPPFVFTLNDVPVGIKLRLFFITGGAVYPLHFGSPLTNVFRFTSASTVNLGAVETANNQAVLPNPPNAGVEFEPPVSDFPSPPGVTPLPPAVTVANPVNNATVPSGPVDITFDLQHVTIGDQNHDHLHFRVDSDQNPYEFVNGSPVGQILHNGSPAVNARWISSTKFLLLNLSSAQHIVTLELATASHTPFVNSQASTLVQFTVDQPPPNPPSTVTITSPTPAQVFPFGPVGVTFAVSHFTVQGQGQPQLHFYVDTDPNVYQFLNGPTNQVWYNGAPTTSVLRTNANIFQFLSLAEGAHSVRFVLANGDSVATELTNTEATAVVSFTINAPIGGSPSLTVNSLGTTPLSPGPVLVTFTIQNSPVTTSAQPRMHFYVDNDTTVHRFYDGQGITEDGSTSGVRYQNVHTHFVHWKSGNSIQLNALASGAHQIRFVLVDQSGVELTATPQILTFTVSPGTGGAFSLQEVVGNLNSPVPMATAPDGRIFVGELSTGNIRVVRPTPSLPWQLQSTPFATVPARNAEGLLGLAVDPSFLTNGYVYAFHPTNASVNRVVRFKAIVANGNTVADNPTPTIILDNIPASSIHNGGVLQFGPDGMLYVFVGDAENPANSQLRTSLAGKILRINPNGSAPADNPFISDVNANAKKVFSLGHRNSLGFTFHPHTDDLWQTENGPDDNDEINWIVAGENYGWPTVRGIAGNLSFRDPLIAYTPSIAPTGIVAIREDSVYPAQYHNNLLFGDFNNGFLHRIVLGGSQLRILVARSIACDCGQGPLFSVMHGLNVPGQDGFIYVTTTTGISRVVLSSP